MRDVRVARDARWRRVGGRGGRLVGPPPALASTHSRYPTNPPAEAAAAAVEPAPCYLHAHKYHQFRVDFANSE